MKRIEVLYEDENCLVLDKPAGLAVQGGEGVGSHLDEILAHEYSPRPLLVHRLDKDTSGIILTAKTSRAAAYFSKMISGRTAVKRYTAICAHLERGQGQNEEPLKKEGGLIKDELVIKGEKKYAETKYRMLRECKGGDTLFVLFELELGTGRMHQIRRSLSLKNYPVLGDDKYGDFKLNKKLHKEYGLKRLLLHSSRLIIPLPTENAQDSLQPSCNILDISSPLPSCFADFLGPESD
ncbi:MAG: RluA family pseudouridine synthase [Spirochaetaceae bacterium]|jgi:23S rRNA pseudouridine955/2504/2580 synthase|nr:RluA family pseudouridine synthase [Spirochaetaceae bacterium]